MQILLGIVWTVFLLFLASRNASLTDLSKCKLTQFGTEYMGTIATTAGGIRCQMWHTEKPLHKVYVNQWLCNQSYVFYYDPSNFRYHHYCTLNIENFRSTLQVSDSITDTDFPERSLQLARNYCRNPTKDPRGPWCYSTESTLIDDACDIPLCNFGGRDAKFWFSFLLLFFFFFKLFEYCI